MKQKKYSKIIVLLIAFLLFFCTNKIYAYNRKYNALILEEGGSFCATIREITKATPDDLQQYQNATRDGNGWVNLPRKDYTSVSVGNDSFTTIGFLFHKNVMSNYHSGFSDLEDGTVINMYYDSPITIDASNSNFDSLITTGNKIYIDINSSGILEDNTALMQGINGTDIYKKRYKITTISGQENRMITDYVIQNSVLKKLLEDNKYWINTNNANSVNIRISHITKTGYRNSDYQQFTTIDTLAKFFSTTRNELPANNRGFDISAKVPLNEKDAAFTPFSSVANLYDNIISLPVGNYYGREVYVRHWNKATGELLDIGSDEQVLINENGEKNLISKMTSDVEDFSYQEYYRYNQAYQMEVSKSLVINADGKKYKYLGANVSTVNSIDEAKQIVAQKQNGYLARRAYSLDYMYSRSKLESGADTTTITTIPSDSDDITVVDFYYEVTDLPDFSVKIGTNTNLWSNDGEMGDCNTTYVPTGEYLKPYLVAPKYIMKDLKYKKVKKDNKIAYQIDQFNVYKLSGGNIKNSSGIDYEGELISGNIIGSNNTTLIDGGDLINLNFIGNDSIKSELDHKMAESYLDFMPTDQDIEALLGEDSNYSFFDTSLYVPTNRLNGVRAVKGEASYHVYNVLNQSETEAGGFRKETKNKHLVNIYTPINLTTPIVTSNVANHTTNSNASAAIEKGSTFTVNISCAGPDFAYYQGVSTTSKYAVRYYVMLDFAVMYEDTLYQKGELIEVKNRNENGAVFTAKVYEEQELAGENLSNATSKVLVFAVAQNIPSDQLLNQVMEVERKIEIEKDPAYSIENRKYINDTGTNLIPFTSICDELKPKASHSIDLIGANMFSDAYYIAKQVVTLRSASRIYDFRITDCSDLAYKNVFRKENSGANINEKTDINYYSGIRRLYIYSKSYSTLLDRQNININGTKTKTILPLGPYKHTAANYINAPKMGYRISFDVKTTGYYIANQGANGGKNVQIIPSYYYISKDGSTLIQDIDLYYKDESGKYQNFANSDYTIYFRPNDGYREIAYNKNNMSTELEPLNIASSQGYFTLTDKMMSVSDTLYNQAWYGEFKLPNTTIAVKKGDSIRNTLQDGYLAVKFDIQCLDFDESGSTTVSYQQNDKSLVQQDNTTQWDYEGYLGFSMLGQKLTESSSLRLQLEKGIWKIATDEDYKFIKGTVVLYDLDNRASSDFE